MKLKEFSISRYGPLSETDKVLLNNFNLFWGKNEIGKTLTIDALVKLLLDSKSKIFDRIDRVEEKPEGYIIIEGKAGKEIKLPEKGILTDILELTPAECNNIFIVRNSNLSIAQELEEEGEFYVSITDKLTGLQTEEIAKINKELLNIGKLTPSGGFKNVKGEKLKKRLERAEEIIDEDIDAIRDQIEENKYDEIEERIAEITKNKKNIREQVKGLEDARNREKYEKGKNELVELEELRENLKGLQVYDDKTQQTWRDQKKNKGFYIEQKENEKKYLKKNEDKLEAVTKELKEKQAKFKTLQKRKEKIDEEYKPNLKRLRKKKADLANKEAKTKLVNIFGIGSIILLIISLITLNFRPELNFLPYLIGIFTFTGIISGILRYLETRQRALVEKLFTFNKLELAKFDLAADNLKGVLSKLQKFADDFSEKEEKLNELRSDKKKFEENIRQSKNEKIPEFDKKIRAAEEKIDEIKLESGVKTIEKFGEKLKLRQNIEESMRDSRIILGDIFGKRKNELEENILYWNNEITQIEHYEDKALGISYSEDKLTDLKENRENLDKELDELSNKMKRIKDNLREVEREVNDILELDEDEYLHCKTAVDLDEVRERLRNFIKENHRTKEDVWAAKNLFEQIESEEKEKVAELFGDNSSVSKYFSEITDGLYLKVNFDQEKEQINVVRKDHTTLSADKLSGGAYDQLYLSIRLALGEKLLKGAKGFFIMDDPFIKADPVRLKRQMEMLKKIAKIGWQIIYFSSKGEIIDVLKEAIDSKEINYREIESSFS